jgi:hypothetical protein
MTIITGHVSLLHTWPLISFIHTMRWPCTLRQRNFQKIQTGNVQLHKAVTFLSNYADTERLILCNTGFHSPCSSSFDDI